MGVGAGEVNMIRLPTFQERAKIATPNKAGTLLGVSPFSSVRNVMAKVQDTSSFIEAARAIHGDRYDYSRTDYVGSGKPITIICKKHGAFVLAEAQSHYGKKQCGCKPCTTEKRKSGEVGVPLKIIACECGFSGSRHEFNIRSELCHACHAKQREEKYTVKCRGCGTRFPKSLKKPFCSHECRNKHKPVTFELKTCGCAACGKQVTKKVYFKYPQNALVCSTNCQRVWAGMCGKGACADWIARSKKAKLLWKKKHSRLRCTESISSEASWWRLCSSKRLLSKQLANQWGTRCASSASGLQQRLVVSTVLKRSKKNRTWQKLCRFAVVKKIDYASMEGWVKKCYSVCKNMKWKRRLRNVKQNIWKPTNRVEQGLRQLGFWE